VVSQDKEKQERGVMFMWIDTKLGTRYVGMGTFHVMLYRWLRYGILAGSKIGNAPDILKKRF